MHWLRIQRGDPRLEGNDVELFMLKNEQDRNDPPSGFSMKS